MHFDIDKLILGAEQFIDPPNALIRNTNTDLQQQSITKIPISEVSNAAITTTNQIETKFLSKELVFIY